ncbi:hypothetical protein BJ878DRAFT_107180 [Calycina marina]|uniref:Uncharacterized protein n=1 Tax=Calycina marina TaxID=1763456 RepID=A0A9P7Z1V8_9HELO|nr:hypothetical protein BJ878DRAFT_107180 [Calycina marina]
MPSRSSIRLPISLYTVRFRSHLSVLQPLVRGQQLMFPGEKPKHIPGEAIIVSGPTRRSDEDGGFLPNLFLNGEAGNSYLLCLDVATMQEFETAEVDVTVDIGFHFCT